MNNPSIPLYQQICRDLARRIAGGELPAHTFLPSMKLLAEKYQCSDIVIRQALKLAGDCGLIATRQGRCSTVREWHRYRGGKVKNLRIAVLQAGKREDCVFDYATGPCSWLFQHHTIKYLQTHGHAAILQSCKFDYRKILENVDGAITLTHPQKLPYPLTIPAVYLHYGSYLPLPPANTVYFSSRSAYRQLATRFAAGNVQAVLLIMTRKNACVWQDLTCRIAFEELLNKGMQPEAVKLLAPESFFSEITKDVTGLLKKLRKFGPVAIITNGDLLAYQAVDAAKSLNMRLRKDIFIIGESALPESARTTPPLTVIKTDFAAAARELCKMSINSIIQSGSPQKNMVINTMLSIRKT